MDLATVRRTAIIAMFSDDVLLEKLVLKGANALHLIHGVGLRASLDIDFSIEEDFDDIEDIRLRIFRSLRDRFDSAGHVVFDENFETRPSQASGKSKNWGGYRVEFKIIERAKYEALPRYEAAELILKLPISDQSKGKILWDNCARLYQIGSRSELGLRHAANDGRDP